VQGACLARRSIATRYRRIRAPNRAQGHDDVARRAIERASRSARVVGGEACGLRPLSDQEEAMKMKLIGLAAIGGLLYAHKKRGGEWTLDSFKTTLRALWSSATRKASQIRDEAREKLEQSNAGGYGSETTGYGGSSYSGFGSNNPDRR
jgi:hypothetical protein